ncbi:MAG: T9SS type A sorting domain-containing protein [Flavobacteriales bacterium]|nr:T9SS type A sorting domain-containing protein [Flavobacteriales bacterium]
MIIRSAPARVALLTLALWSLSAPVAWAQGVDDCSQAVPDVLEAGTPLLWTGDNSTATATGDALPGTAAAGTANFWHVFTTDTCTNITIDYCGSPTVFGSNDIWNALFTTCPADNQYLPAAFVNGSACGDGNATAQFNNVPAGTYYFPVYMPPGGGGPYAINVTAAACQAIVPPANDSCYTAVPEPLASGGTLIFSGDNTNATHEGDWIPGFPFSTAQVVWHAITTDACNDLVVSYCGLNPSWDNALGFLALTCPGDSANREFCDDCNYTECGDGNPTFHFSNVAAGTYYIPVMLDAGNNAIGPYSISVSATACAGGVPNDDCSQVLPEVLAVNDTLAFSGDNTNATPDSDFVPGSPFAGAPVVWHAITTTTCSNVTVSYCGLAPVWDNAFGFLSLDCPGDSLLFFSTFNDNDCGDGNLTYIYYEVPAGTYYIPVVLDPGNNAVGPYTIQVSATGCAAPTFQDLCSQTIAQTLAVGDTLVLAGDNSNATPTGDFVQTSPFAGAPVVWHQISLPTCADVTVRYCGLNPTWTNAFGFMATSCPADSLVFFSTFDTTSCGDGNLTYSFDELAAGDYYVPVVLDPGNNAVGPYAIEVIAAACPGSNAPVNDLCGDVVVNDLAPGDTLTLVGDNTGATAVGDWVPNSPFALAPVVWHAFNTDTCTEVTISYCGLNPAWTNSFGFLVTSCPGDSVVYFSTFNDTICGDQNVSYFFYQLEAGTYYVPVVLDPGNNAVGPYSIEVSAVNCLGTGLAENGRPSFSVFPNPSNGDMTVQNNGAFAVQWIEVLDVSGRSMHRERVNLAPGQRFDLHLQGRAEQGMYILRAVGAEGRAEQHFVVR